MKETAGTMLRRIFPIAITALALLAGRAVIAGEVQVERIPNVGAGQEGLKAKAAKAWDWSEEAAREAWEKTTEVTTEAWDKTREVSNKTWEKTKSVSQEGWEKTKQVSKETWEKTRAKTGEVVEGVMGRKPPASGSEGGPAVEEKRVGE